MYKIITKTRTLLLVFLTHNMALPLLQLLRNEEQFTYSLAQLVAMPEDTLGSRLAGFLRQRNLRLLPYYARHDIKHVLLDYDTTGEGEVCLQCFMLGNGHLSFPVAATVVFGVITMPEYWGPFNKAFRRGKKSISIEKWKWFELIPRPLISLQQQLTGTP